MEKKIEETDEEPIVEKSAKKNDVAFIGSEEEFDDKDELGEDDLDEIEED